MDKLASSFAKQHYYEDLNHGSPGCFKTEDTQEAPYSLLTKTRDSTQEETTGPSAEAPTQGQQALTS